MRNFIFVMLASFPALAAPAYAGCEVGHAMLAASQQAIDAKTQRAQHDAEAILAQAQQQNQPQQGAQAGNGQTCLDQIANIGISASAGFPSIEEVNKALKKAAAQKACQVAIGQINGAVGAANGAINRTGINQVPGAGVNVGTNSQGGISTTTQNTSSQAAGSIWDRVQSIFR